MESLKLETNLLTLPPELLGQIMAASDLNSLRALSTTCSTLRAIGNEEGIHIPPLARALVGTGNRMATEGPFDDEELSSIQRAARLAPVNSLLPTLSVASRRFLLYQFEIPRLSGEQWKRICSSRFLASVVAKFERIFEEQGGRAGIWRELYMRTIHKYEMLSQGTTVPNSEAMCQYIVIHRSGFSRNRKAMREFNPLLVFHDLKVQNLLSNHTTFRSEISAHLTPPDVRLEAIYTVDDISHLLANKLARAFLDPVGIKLDPGMIFVGPIILAASTRPCPAVRGEPDLNARRYVSFDGNCDLTELAKLVSLPQQWWDQLNVQDRSGFT